MITVDTKDIVWYLVESQSRVKAISFSREVDILSSLVKQTMPKNWQATIAVWYEEPLPKESVDSKKVFDFSDQSVDGWLSLIKDKLYSIPTVEDIFVSIEDNNIDVWVVIPKRDIPVLRQLVDCEGQILEIFHGGKHPIFLIDFHVIYRCGRNIEDIAPTRAIKLPR